MSNDTRQVYDAHLAALAAADLDAIVAGYDAEAVLASNAGIGRGHEYIRTVFAGFLDGNAVEPVSQVQELDNVLYVSWTASTPDGDLAGADTFVVREGLIAVHSGFFTRTG